MAKRGYTRIKKENVGWTLPKSISLKNSGNWVPVKTAWTKVNGVWEQIWPNPLANCWPSVTSLTYSGYYTLNTDKQRITITNTGDDILTINKVTALSTTVYTTNIDYTGLNQYSGEQVFSTPGTYQWTCPPGVVSVSVLTIGGGGAGGTAVYGGGGGGGGGVGFKNSITVVPGQKYTVVVGAAGAGQLPYDSRSGFLGFFGATVVPGGNGTSGGDSYFINAATVKGAGGTAGSGSTTTANAVYSGGAGGAFVGDGGGRGGNGGLGTGGISGGGGGAGGYSGPGGNGGQVNVVPTSSAGGAGVGGKTNADDGNRILTAGAEFVAFNLSKSATGIKSVTNGAYCGFLNSNGVWLNSNTQTFDQTFTVNFPYTSYYTITSSCDNTGYVYLDGSPVLTAPGYSTTYTANVRITAGTHTVRCLGQNAGGAFTNQNPASFAVKITKLFNGSAQSGGGVGIYGQTTTTLSTPGAGGSDGTNGAALGSNGGSGSTGGRYGAGGAGMTTYDKSLRGSDGGSGLVRIVYPGTYRQFPTTDVTQVDTITGGGQQAPTIIPPGLSAYVDVSLYGAAIGTSSDGGVRFDYSKGTWPDQGTGSLLIPINATMIRLYARASTPTTALTWNVNWYPYGGSLFGGGTYFSGTYTSDIVITNTGNDVLRFGTPTTSTGVRVTKSINSIPPGQSATMTIVYVKRPNPGAYSDSIVINTNSDQGAITIPIAVTQIDHNSINWVAGQTGKWTVPYGITSVAVTVQGGGGGGAGGSDNEEALYLGGGGGGGGAVSTTIGVTPGQQINFLVGYGGAAGGVGQQGGAGGGSSFGTVSTGGGGGGGWGGGSGGTAGGNGATAGAPGIYWPYSSSTGGGAGGSPNGGTGGGYNEGAERGTAGAAGGDGYISISW